MDLPSVGSRVVHKDDYAKSSGPVWEVTKVQPHLPRPIQIEHAPKHKLNVGRDNDVKLLTPEQYHNEYKPL